jgi:hypothetical protein
MMNLGEGCLFSNEVNPYLNIPMCVCSIPIHQKREFQFFTTYTTGDFIAYFSLGPVLKKVYIFGIGLFYRHCCTTCR